MIRKFVLFVIIIGAISAVAYFYFYKQRSATYNYEVARKVFKVKLSEAKLTASVKAALSLHKNFKFFDIQVEADDGIVTLGGILPSKKTKQLALEIASNVKGVRKVIDQISIDPSVVKKGSIDERTIGEGIDDAAINANVKTALALHKKLRGSKIEVSTFKKIVFLEGVVLSEEQKRIAIAIAFGVDNVRDVKADLIIK